MKKLQIAVVGAGPAGIYAADILVKQAAEAGVEVLVDVVERDPAPYGLIRYGVAPDHPRIKEIVKALRRVMSQDAVRFVGNVDVGVDVSVSELGEHYDAVVLATGARTDRASDLPGVELEGSFGGADFVAWYNGHPDVARDWPFDPAATSVAVLGVGNVALDVARILAKTADELLVTEIPANVHAGLATNVATDVHLFARRGPAQAKFSPMELRELSHSPNVEVVVHPEGFEFDEGSMELLRNAKSSKLVVDVLTNYLAREPEGAPHRVHIHFCHNPVEILGEDGRVVGLRTEVTELDGTGNVRGTGEYAEWPVGAVYRAIGYASSPLPGVPFDAASATVPHAAGRVLDGAGEHVPGLYATGWVKRGPIGLIGHTKSDAAETVACLLADLAGDGAAAVGGPAYPQEDSFAKLLESRGVTTTSWAGWEALDAHEVALGAAQGRDRVKVVPREEMVALSVPTDGRDL